MTVIRFIISILLIINYRVSNQKFEIDPLQRKYSDDYSWLDTVGPIKRYSFADNRFTYARIGHNRSKSEVDRLSDTFKNTVKRLRERTKKIDIVFLIDSSSSVGKKNFISEIKFVKKLLGDFNVSYNHTRVAIVTFSSQAKIIRHVDQISDPKDINDKCKLLHNQIPKIKFVGGGTYTFGALREAKSILTKARKHSQKVIFLITDGFSNGKDPVPIAQKLKHDNVTIVTFGIQSGNYVELNNVSSYPPEQNNFLLSSFMQFESLARKALHTDYKVGHNIRLYNQTLCDGLCDNIQGNGSHSCCDPNADCTCGTTSGHYACTCKPGYYGSGLVNNCELCPNGTYWHHTNLCKPCPDINHITTEMPALNVSYCGCKTGFKARSGNRCEVITCPELKAPTNGYFVKHLTDCTHVLNAACGARCKSGYQLVGSSIRLCQANGTWSGSETSCVLKTCPKLPIPYYGMVTCKNADLNLFFDYTPRNDTFMEKYHSDDMRITEPMPIDTDCNFKCGPGFYMVGSGMRNCLPLSKWDGLQTTCKQILCSALPSVNFGSYDPTDCTTDRLVHGTNCTLSCAPGFEVKGPSVKMCGGKRAGVWINKNKLGKCVDVTPPKIICPDNFTVPLADEDNYALLMFLPPPNVSDNSELNITTWLKPAIKSGGIKLHMGNHTFTYIAVDSFKNKAKCNFTITVIDITPPVMDNCRDPPLFIIPKVDKENLNDSYVNWDEPIIYDNSNTELFVNQTISPGFLPIGVHSVQYIAVDPSGNRNECFVNVTVRERQCESLKSPVNGQTVCAKNVTHTWCNVICNIGHGIYDDLDEKILENFTLSCQHKYAKWRYEIVPDCTSIELPASIEQVFSIDINSEQPICGDNETKNELKNEFMKQIQDEMCGEQEDCTIISDIPDCEDVLPPIIPIDNQFDNNTFYTIVKRDVNRKERKKTSRSTVKIRIYTRIAKKLGIWNSNKTRSSNIRRVKAELRGVQFNENLKIKLDNLKININQLKIDEFISCRNGSLSKNGLCVQCPRGTYHYITAAQCRLCPYDTYNQFLGSMNCTLCPDHYTAQKFGSKSIDECKQQCPPGMIARIKSPYAKNELRSFMPFCRKCTQGQFQSEYDQTKCDECPIGYTSKRGASSLNDCVPEQACIEQPNVCGLHGQCISEGQHNSLYSCLCEDGYVGSHCEHFLDICLSVPCQNHGTCLQINATAFTCKCARQFTGEFCEQKNDKCAENPCQNGGACVMDAYDNVTCECVSGYEGEFCERQLNFCTENLCEGDSKCITTENGYYCQCPPGFMGRRCHLRPCDYIPCHKYAICVDLLVYPTTRSSFKCQCPSGLKGYDCQTVDNPCDSKPCRNNGYCTPLALRNPYDIKAMVDDSEFEKYSCKCPPYFYGKHCEVLTTPDFIMGFSRSGTSDFVKIKGPVHNLTEISLCTWIQTDDSFNYGTLLSYGTEANDNMLTLTDYNGFVFYVNGNSIVTDIIINDGQWHFLCISWMSYQGFYEMYVDGTLAHTGFNLSANSVIEANGTLIIGQEQDSLGASFSESESFIGNISNLDVWDRFIPAHEVLDYFTSCEPYQGNLYAWADFKENIHGAVQILATSFCKPCPNYLSVSNGHVKMVGGRAVYLCNEGYKIHGPIIRNCLRTSQWSLPVPYCKSVHCEHLPHLPNGKVSVVKSVFGEEIKFTCNAGFVLKGTDTSICRKNGDWSSSSEMPECISTAQCNRIDDMFNAQIIYANEEGRLENDLATYPIGTFSEIQCLNETQPLGENFLTCTDTGQWDYPIPICIDKIDNFTTSRNTESTTVISDSSTTKASFFDNDETSMIPSKSFWSNLRRFIYNGCSMKDLRKQSELCSFTTHPVRYTDLSDFEYNDSAEFKDMDTKLLNYLERAASLLDSNLQSNITFENMIEFILYSDQMCNPINKLSRSVENSFRLVISFFIDSLLLDSNLNVHNQYDLNENITDKIKLLISQIVNVVHIHYKEKRNEISNRNQEQTVLE